MKKALFLFAAILCALSVFAKDMLVARAGENTLTLHDTPCGKEVSALLKPEVVAQFRAATDSANGTTWKACWILHDLGNIFVVYEDGDRAMVPFSEFVRADLDVKPKPKQSKGSV